MKKAKIKLASNNLEALQEIIQQITTISKKAGVKLGGPVPLPTKKMSIMVRKTPCGQGTMTYDRYFMSIHKRLLNIAMEERVLNSIMSLQFPDEILVEIELN
jgi:small subunit ribosomal protein S10